jgi:hypothetical protein
MGRTRKQANRGSQHDNVQEAELSASSDEIARETARHIFAVFNWYVTDNGFLIEWQKRLRSRNA